MVDDPLETRVYPPYLPEDRQALEAFLERHGLRWEPDIEYSLALFEGGRMVGTGSLAGRTLKCFAVEEARRGSGLAASLVSRLEAEAAVRGVSRPFIFTLPGSEPVFTSLGYRRIEAVPGAVVLLERGDGIGRWTERLKALARPRSGAPVSALVMNCNPLTLGHLHLIRTAALQSGWVFLFVVSEEASVFPFDVRLRLVEAETAALPNVTVLPGSEYLVSRATFPSYFLSGGCSEAAELHARLDARIFASRIAPALGVSRRYLGEEPYCPVTALYNRVLKQELQAVEVVEIPRLARDGQPVSASEVRRLIRGGDLLSALDLVPPATTAYLMSEEAAPVIARIAAENGRH
jgi:[citrate (pro-3S)-lyase] ligase